MKKSKQASDPGFREAMADLLERIVLAVMAFSDRRVPGFRAFRTEIDAGRAQAWKGERRTMRMLFPFLSALTFALFFLFFGMSLLGSLGGSLGQSLSIGIFMAAFAAWFGYELGVVVFMVNDRFHRRKENSERE